MTTTIPTPQLRPHIPTCLTCRTPKNAKQQALSQNQVQITYGTALAEAGVDLAVIQALLGHAHVDSSVGYIHLAPVRVRAAYDQARAVQRARA